MGDSIRHGPPKVSGEERKPLDAFYYPSVFGLPFMIQIEGSDDQFLMIFTTEQLLRAHMDKPNVRRVLQQSFQTTHYGVRKVDRAHEFLSVIWSQGCRVMLDPEVVSEHHTRWKEPVPDDDEKLIYVRTQ